MFKRGQTGEGGTSPRGRRTGPWGKTTVQEEDKRRTVEEELKKEKGLTDASKGQEKKTTCRLISRKTTREGDTNVKSEKESL